MPPPPEPRGEIIRNGLLKLVSNKGKKSTLFIDGCEAWSKASKKICRHVFVKRVNYKKMEFACTNNIDRKGEVALRGAQAIDRRWQGLDKYIPQTVVAKVKKDVNGAIATYIFSWVWRTWLPKDHNLLEEVGKLCKRHRELGWSAVRPQQ